MCQKTKDLKFEILFSLGLLIFTDKIYATRSISPSLGDMLLMQSNFFGLRVLGLPYFGLHSRPQRTHLSLLPGGALAFGKVDT